MTDGDQDRPPPVRGIAADLVRVRDAPFPDELPKAIFVDPLAAASAGRPMSRTRAQPIEQLLAHGPPSARSGAFRSQASGVALERRIDRSSRSSLASCSAETPAKQRIGGALAGPGAAGNGGALDHRRRRQDDLRGAQRRDQRRRRSVGRDRCSKRTARRPRS